MNRWNSVHSSVKSCFQNMEICKRRSSYDSSKTLYSASAVPSAAGNLTVTFSSQLNQHNQVTTSAGGQKLYPCTRRTSCFIRRETVAIIVFVLNFSPRCLLRGEQFLCWTTNQHCTSRPLLTFPGSLNKASQFQHVLLVCVARQSLSSKLWLSALLPLSKVKIKVADSQKKWWKCFYQIYLQSGKI